MRKNPREEDFVKGSKYVVVTTCHIPIMNDFPGFIQRRCKKCELLVENIKDEILMALTL